MTSYTPRDLKRLVLSVASGANFPVVLSGDFFFVESVYIEGKNVNATGLIDPVTIKPDTVQVAAQVYTGTKERFAVPFNNLEVFNGSNNLTITLILWVGFGDYEPGIVRTGPLVTQLFTSTTTTVLAPYTIGDQVGQNMTLTGAFAPNFNNARITRALLGAGTTNTTLANFRLNIFNASATLPVVADNAPLPLSVSNLTIGGMLSPIVFPTFVTGTGGASNEMMYCDICGLDVPCYKYGVGALTTQTSLLFQLSALSAFNPGVAGFSWYLFLTIEQY